MWFDSRDKPDGAKKIAERVAHLTREHNLDWICLQEIFRYDAWGADGNLLKLIKDATGWNHIFIRGSQYHYEKGKERPGKNYEDGIATFSKWPIKSHHTVRLGPWAKGQLVGIPGQRSLLDTVLKTSLGDITVGNTHWTRIHRKYRIHRRAEMGKFRQHIERLHHDMPYVVGGDFNTLPAHPIIKSLRQPLDLRTGSAKRTTWLHTGKPRGLLRLNLDYVGTLRSGPLEMTDFRLLHRRPSDHTPLLTAFELQHRKR